jgi:hypothetical protein
MTDPRLMTDDEFLRAFLDCSMPPAGFDHAGHVRAAWLILRRYPLDEAVEHTCAGIAALANHLGVPGKYHRTLSEALVRLMAHGGACDPAMSLAEFMAANRGLMADARGLLAQHYSDACLASAEARVFFVAPDRLPLPA